jgi:neutral ceramidase
MNREPAASGAGARRPCHHRPVRRLVLAVLTAALLLPASPAAAQELLAGVGRADITPPTGYALGGYTRQDRTGEGVHTRLTTTALVLQRGDRKVALVAMDLFMVPAGMVKEAAERNADLGFGEHNVLVSVSHTHSGPSSFANFFTFNTLAPSTSTITDPTSFTNFLQPQPPDRRLYTFLVDQLAKAIRQAARGARPAAVGWGEARLTDVTRNRSIEAHLADHGITEDRGAGRAEQDPDGVLHTIDPEVHVLRVDRVVVRRRGGKRRRVRIPIGGWSSFANHGTVVPATYGLYNQDHHGAAIRVFERRVRSAANVSPKRMIVNVYGNSNEGDQSAGLDGQSIEIAERVGRREANAMFEAWQQAGRSMTRGPAFDLRWTRACFCGQDLGEGRRVSREPVAGLPFLTGSEEERGPLYDVTGVPFEDRRSPADAGDSQGHKIGVSGATSTETVPKAVPLMTVRIRDRVIASLPGEPTVEVGRRVERAVLGAMGGAGVRRAIVSGLAGEFVQYLTTPEEYERQHYEGGSTLWGMYAALHLEQQLGQLAGRMARGEPAQEPYPFDPRNGVTADAPPLFDPGAERGELLEQPRDVRREARTSFAWRGAPRGLDRPLDEAFVSIERRVGGRWRHQDDDLWLHLAWRVDAEGRYTATWTPQHDAPAGEHRFVVTARRYRLVSEPFSVR